MNKAISLSIAIIAGLGLGAGAAWTMAGKGMGRADIVNGPWTTSLGFGTKATDAATRAAVARRGLLALPATETIYWQASVDSDGKPLKGNCTYAMTGAALDARWWSVTYYDKAGYLVANPAGIWSFSGASITPQEASGWRVIVSAVRPASGHWIPSAKGKPFDLTLRMYNPGAGLRAAPAKAALPTLTREGCA